MSIICLAFFLAVNHTSFAQIQPSVQLKQIRELVQNSAFSKANLIIEGMQQKHPYMPELHYLKGICAFHLHDYSEAVSSFTLAEPHAKKNEHLYYYRSLCHYFLEAYPSALTDAKKAYSINPKDHEAAFLIAIINKEQGNYLESNSRLKPLHHIESPSPEVFLLTASNYQALDSIEQAIASLRIGADAIPLNPNILSRLAMLYLQSEQYAKVPTLLEDALLSDSLHIYTWYTLSRYHREMGHSDAFVSTTEKLISLNPFSALPYYDLGVFYFENGAHDKAINQLSMAMDLAPGVALAPFALAEVYALKKEINLAVQFYEETIMRFPFHIEAHEKLVHYLSNSSATEAKAYYKKQLNNLKAKKDSIESDTAILELAETALAFTPLFDQRWLPGESDIPHEPQPKMIRIISATETDIARAKKQGEFLTSASLGLETVFLGAIDGLDPTPLTHNSDAIDSAVYYHSKNQLSKADDILDRKIGETPVAPWLHLLRAAVAFDMYLLTSKFSTSETVDQDQLQQLEFIARDLALEAQIQPNQPYAHYNLGLIYAELQMFDKAVEQFELSTQKDKNLAPGWHQLGIAYQQSGASMDACKAWYKAIQLNYPHSKKWVDALCP